MAKALKSVGIPRPLDDLGRVVVAKEYRNLLQIDRGTQMCQTLLTDPETGRVAGILFTPLEWVADPASAPYIDWALEQLSKQKKGEGR